MKDRSTLYLACAALGTLALAAAPAPQAHDDGAHAQGATNQQQFSNQSRRNELVKIVRQVTGKYTVRRTRRERWLSAVVRLRQR